MSNAVVNAGEATKELPINGATTGLDLGAIDALEDSALKDALRRFDHERTHEADGVTVHSSHSSTPHSSAMW